MKRVSNQELGLAGKAFVLQYWGMEFGSQYSDKYWTSVVITTLGTDMGDSKSKLIS